MTNEFSLDKFLKIANTSVLKAQKHHRQLHLPNIYVKNEKIIYEYDGKETSKPPHDFQLHSKKSKIQKIEII